MARPTKFNEKTKRRIYKALRIGASKKHAAYAAGISYELLRQWMQKGKQEESKEFIAFLAALKRAESDFCMKALKNINDAGTKKWQAAAWLLERRYPEHYGKNRQPEPEPFISLRVVEGTKFTDPWLVEDEEETFEV